MREEKLMKQLCNEMGIEWVEGNHEPMINGVPCEELDIEQLMRNHVLKMSENKYDCNVCINRKHCAGCTVKRKSKAQQLCCQGSMFEPGLFATALKRLREKSYQKYLEVK